MNENIFVGVSEIYAKYRPDYPASLMNYLKYIGLNSDSIVADIGAGTGILTNHLLNLCAKVYAIEPNDDMRNISEKTHNGNPKFHAINATAENTTLSNNSVDFITAAQSFHWFDKQAFRAECLRILKPCGKIILIWNRRDETNTMVQEIDAISHKYCPLFSGATNGMRGANSENAYQDFFVNGYTTKIVANDIIFDKERFVGLHQSASYRLSEDNPDYFNYIGELSHYFDLHSTAGQLILPNKTCCYVGTL
ncbi:MAG: class I SAM-dependent methyltransferase [Lachnospiraceae bacterium]|nr:class I SAM-dependent methyltransferase [Lachnospiraceae bacterium]